MPNIVGVGLCDNDVAVLVEKLLLNLHHEKPEDVVVSWFSREKRVHNLVDIHASTDCSDRTIRLVAQACREAGLSAHPNRYQPTHHSGHPTVRGWGIPEFVGTASRIAGAVPVNVSPSENSRVINLAGNEAPYVEVVSPWPNSIGAAKANELAQHVAVIFAAHFDVELFHTNDCMTFIPKIVSTENAPP